MEEKILNQVRHMLDKANHPNTGEAERELCLRRADTLMLRHAIDQAMLDATKRDDRRQPIPNRFRAFERWGDGWEYTSKFQTIIWELARTYRCKAAIHPDGDVTIVGMPDDVQYFEMIWTNIYFGFITKMYPRWQDNLSFEHNVYNYKTAGYKWPEIRDVAREHQHHVPWPDGGMLIRAYKKHARVVGDERQIKTQRHAAFRESYAEGFTRQVCRRLEDFRYESAETAKGSGAELALVDVEERVKEEFYNLFPDFRPMTAEQLEELRAAQRKQEEEAASRLQEELDAMTPAQRRKYEEAQERQRIKDAKDSDRYWKDLEEKRERNYDPDGMRVGRSSGNSVDLGGRERLGGGSAGELG